MTTTFFGRHPSDFVLSMLVSRLAVGVLLLPPRLFEGCLRRQREGGGVVVEGMVTMG